MAFVREAVALPTKTGVYRIELNKEQMIEIPSCNPPRTVYGPMIVHITIWPDGGIDTRLEDVS